MFGEPAQSLRKTFTPSEFDQQVFALKFPGERVPVEKRCPHLRTTPADVEPTWRVDSVVPALGELVGAIKQPYEIVWRFWPRFRTFWIGRVYGGPEHFALKAIAPERIPFWERHLSFPAGD